MALQSLTAVQVDFSAGQITEKAARRDDVKLQRSGLKRSINTRAVASGALQQRMGRSAYDLDTGRTETVRFSDILKFGFLFGDGALRIRDMDGVLLNEFLDMPWTIDTIADIGVAVTERDVFLTYPGTRPKQLRLGSSSAIELTDGTPFGDLVDAIAYPVVAATNKSKQDSNIRVHSVSLPSGIAAGDLLIVLFRTPSGGATHTPPSGWATLASRISNGTTSIFWRVANGSEGSTINVDAGDTERSVANSYRITGFGGSPQAAFASTNVTDPPSLTPSWGSSKVLWLALVSMRRSNQTITAAPGSYTNLVDQANTSNSSPTYAHIGSARRTTTASSENPGAFSITGTAEEPHAATIAINSFSSVTEATRAFDGVTNKTAAQSIEKLAATSALIGLNLTASPQAVSGATVYGSNDQGYVGSITPTVTLTLYGKNGSVPTLGSPGTSLGTAVFTDTANESGGRSITSSDTTTLYDYVAVVVSHGGAANPIYVAQVAFTTPVAAIDANNWLIGPFLFDETPEGALRQPYFRFATHGIEMLCSARTGNAIDVTFSGPVLAAEHVGVSFRFHDREIVITSVTSATAGKANVIERLPPTRRVTLANANSRDAFKVGQVAIGADSGAEGLIVATNGTANLDIIVYKGDNYTDTEKIASPTGSGVVTGTPSEITLAASVVWDEAVMSDYRGWPSSIRYDRSRLILCDFPQLPRYIAWSAIGAPNDHLAGAEADEAFQELCDGSGRVRHVIGGNDEFVLTDLGCYYIPISESNPLAPGRVAFRVIAAVGAGTVQPVQMHEGIVYATENAKSLIAIVPTGQTSFPYRTAAISEFHADIFTGVRAMAAMAGGGSQTEQYLWVVQDDGTAIVGKFDSSNEWAGFVPVTGEGLIRWVSALGGDVLFNVEYDTAFDWVMERLDEDMFGDCGVPLNQTLPLLRPNPEDLTKGRLWFLAGLTVNIMDGKTHLGARLVDADGFVVEETDDDFTGDDITAVFAFDLTVSMYLPNVPEGAEKGQRVGLRSVKRAVAHVQDSTQFTFMGRIFSGTLPVSGIFGESGVGRSPEPEVVLTKTVPGPIRITELDVEVTI